MYVCIYIYICIHAYIHVYIQNILDRTCVTNKQLEFSIKKTHTVFFPIIDSALNKILINKTDL